MKKTETKTEIRKKIQKKRNRLTKNQRLEKSRIIATKLLASSLYQYSTVLMAYWPFRSEIDTTLIIHKALADQKMVVLPKVNRRKLDLYYIQNPGLDLKPGVYGIMEPVEKKCNPALAHDLDMVMVPGVAFDIDLNRLGYGGGYYDRFLAALDQRVKKIALCFDLQIISQVPSMAHDVKLDGLITETKEIFCPSRKKR